MRVSSRLKDAHLYLMRRWVLDYLADNKSVLHYCTGCAQVCVCVCVCVCVDQ